jgi:hypothetical protein
MSGDTGERTRIQQVEDLTSKLNEEDHNLYRQRRNLGHLLDVVTTNRSDRYGQDRQAISEDEASDLASDYLGRVD